MSDMYQDERVVLELHSEALTNILSVYGTDIGMKYLYTPCCRHQTPNPLEHFVVHIVWPRLQRFLLLHQSIPQPNRDTGQKWSAIILEYQEAGSRFYPLKL
jgi:hypothetical protein